MPDPEAIRLWQRALCREHGLRGRIIISKDGINGTVGGPITSVKQYVRTMREYALFRGIDFKWSDGTGNDFPRLRVRVRDEIVTFGVPQEIQVDENGIVGGGVRLSPREVNELVESRGNEVVFLDGRNAYEARIGRFRGAIVPDVATTPDFVRELESGRYDHLKDRPVVTYCTGGIRCEVLSMVMRNRGFREVYQIDGGIVRYAEQYRDKGLWEGSLYVFDGRTRLDYGRHENLLGTCDYCGDATNDFRNCEPSDCRTRILVCTTCAEANPVVLCADCRVAVG